MLSPVPDDYTSTRLLAEARRRISLYLPPINYVDLPKTSHNGMKKPFTLIKQRVIPKVN